DAWTDNGKTPRSLPHADGVANISDRFYRYGPLYGDNLCSNGKAVWKSSTPCETDTGTIQVGYFGDKVFAVSYGGTLQLFGYKGTPLAKATTRNNGGNNGGGGLGLFPGIGGSSSAGASSGNAAADAKQNSSIGDLARQLLLGQGHGGGG